MSELLTTDRLYTVLSRTFPEQNDFLKESYDEELEELNHFGIITVEELDALLSKHLEKVMEIDAEDLDDEHIGWYTDLYGKDYVQERLNGKFWFAYPGLLRLALELEFGDDYVSFAEERESSRDINLFNSVSLNNSFHISEH